MIPLFLFSVCFGSQISDAYAMKDVEHLRGLYAHAPTRGDSLLVLYRLYPLVEDQQLLRDIPTTLDSATGREMAVLAALWAYRMADAGVFDKMTFAGRWNALMQRARETAPDDAFVRLVHAQSVYYMPSFIGGGKQRAVRYFKQLYDRLKETPQCGVSTLEIEVWISYGLAQIGDPDAEAMRAELLARGLPPLFREVLEPPS